MDNPIGSMPANKSQDPLVEYMASEGPRIATDWWFEGNLEVPVDTHVEWAAIPSANDVGGQLFPPHRPPPLALVPRSPFDNSGVGDLYSATSSSSSALLTPGSGSPGMNGNAKYWEQDYIFPGTPSSATSGFLGASLYGSLGVEPDLCLDRRPPDRDEQFEERGVTVPDQAPDVAVNGVAPGLPPVKLPSGIRSATALGCSPEQEGLTEVGSGTNLLAANTAPVARRTVRPPTKYVCEECTMSQGRVISFQCKKNLKRHRASTKAHNAHAVLYCNCGKGVTRRDAMKIHHKYCSGYTLQSGSGAGN